MRLTLTPPPARPATAPPARPATRPPARPATPPPARPPTATPPEPGVVFAGLLASVPGGARHADPETGTNADTEPGTGTGTDADADVGTSYARCADGNGTLSYLFFSDDDYELARAKAICRLCGLRETCLSGALERQEPYGVWGGLLVLDGVAVEVKRKRGRPPKQPKPVLVVDEAPIPDHLVA